MKAVTWHGRRDVRVDTVPDPEIHAPTDTEPQRHRVRAEALPRLEAKLTAAGRPAAVSPPPRPEALPPAPLPAAGDATSAPQPPRPAPDRNDPLHGLQQILRDAAQ